MPDRGFRHPAAGLFLCAPQKRNDGRGRPAGGWGRCDPRRPRPDRAGTPPGSWGVVQPASSGRFAAGRAGARSTVGDLKANAVQIPLSRRLVAGHMKYPSRGRRGAARRPHGRPESRPSEGRLAVGPRDGYFICPAEDVARAGLKAATTNRGGPAGCTLGPALRMRCARRCVRRLTIRQWCNRPRYCDWPFAPFTIRRSRAGRFGMRLAMGCASLLASG